MISTSENAPSVQTDLVAHEAAQGSSPEAAPPIARSASRVWRTRALAAGSAVLVVGLIMLLWSGIVQRERGTVGEVTVPFRQAPNFELGLFGGGTFRLSNEFAGGKPVFVNFWASWCVPCRAEAPVLQSAWQRNSDRLTIVGVDVEDTEADALAFLKEFGITYPNGAGNSGPTSIAYGMRGVPESYFIATDGRILRKWNGPLTTAKLDQFLDEMISASGNRP